VDEKCKCLDHVGFEMSVSVSVSGGAKPAERGQLHRWRCRLKRWWCPLAAFGDFDGPFSETKDRGPEIEDRRPNIEDRTSQEKKRPLSSANIQ